MYFLRYARWIGCGAWYINMAFHIYLSETQSSLAMVLFTLGAALFLSRLADRKNTWHRTALLSVTAFLAVRYTWWRGTETLAEFGFTWDAMVSWSLFILEFATIVGTLSVALILTRTRERSREADENASWWTAEPAPHVAVLIATYNEGIEVLRRTVVGALALDYPSFEVLVLDDGRRDWLKDFCAERGVRYLRRPDNKGSKAGNINHALDRLSEDEITPDFIAVLDADFVPHREFLLRTLALLKDPSVGIVQTPQHFFNADPIQNNLNLSRAYPDEQRFFFDHLQPSRDAWGIPMCCGTSSVTRWAAVREIGGLPQNCVTEDYLLTLTLQSRGYNTIYLNEPLSEGLAPEGLSEYITQRARWCLGMMQIVRGPFGPFGAANTRLRDRWSVVDAFLFWLTASAFRLAAITTPLLYWYFGIIAVNASVSDVIFHFGVYYVWSILIMQFLSKGTLLPLLVDVSQLLCAIQIMRAVGIGLFKPFGHKFAVTAKGGDRNRIVVQWRQLILFATLLVLTLIGMLLGSIFDSFADFNAGSGKKVVLFWSFYNVLVLSLTAIVCVELPRREAHVMDAPERTILRLGEDSPHRVWLSQLTSYDAHVRGRSYAVKNKGVIRIPKVGDVKFIVQPPTEDGTRLALEPTKTQRDALLLRLHAQGGAPGTKSLNMDNFLRDFAMRILFIK